jgi:CBS domain-containing protein
MQHQYSPHLHLNESSTHQMTHQILVTRKLFKKELVSKVKKAKMADYPAMIYQDAASIIYEKLGSIMIADIVNTKKNKKPLVSIHEDANIQQALDLLQKHNILALPVFSLKDGKKQFSSIISIYDILSKTGTYFSFFLKLLVFQKLFEELEASENEEDPKSFNDYLEAIKHEKTFLFEKIKSLVGETIESRETWILNTTDHIGTLLQLFTSSGYHRTLIMDESPLKKNIPEEERMTIISQTDLVRYLVENREKFGLKKIELDQLFEQAAENISELQRLRSKSGDPTQPVTRPETNKVTGKVIDPREQALKKKVVSVDVNVSAINALKRMFINRVSGVAVVDAQKKLVANLSASDLRGINRENLEMLIKPVYKFLEETCKQRSKESLKPDQVLSVEEDKASVLKVINSCLQNGVHRVYITDEVDTVTGVITLTDFLSMFVPVGKEMTEE